MIPSGDCPAGRGVFTHSLPFFCIHWRERWQGLEARAKREKNGKDCGLRCCCCGAFCPGRRPGRGERDTGFLSPCQAVFFLSCGRGRCLVNGRSTLLTPKKGPGGCDNPTLPPAQKNPSMSMDDLPPDSGGRHHDHRDGLLPWGCTLGSRPERKKKFCCDAKKFFQRSERGENPCSGSAPALWKSRVVWLSGCGKVLINAFCRM